MTDERRKELLQMYWAAQAQFGPFEVGPDEFLRQNEEPAKDESL